MSTFVVKLNGRTFEVGALQLFNAIERELHDLAEDETRDVDDVVMMVWRLVNTVALHDLEGREASNAKARPLRLTPRSAGAHL